MKSRIKRVTNVLLTVAMLLTVLCVPVAFAREAGVALSPTVSVYIDGEKLEMTEFTGYVRIINGRTMLPMRVIFEALGAEVTWNQTSKTAQGSKDGIIVALTVGQDLMSVDSLRANDVVELDVPPLLLNSRTYIPARAVAEAFGYDVDWDGATKTVTITTFSKGTGEDDDISGVVSRKLTATYISDSGSANNAEQAKNLFDLDVDTKWCTHSSEPYVIWKMSEPVSATGYLFVTANDNSRYPGRNPRAWTLYGCNASFTPDNGSSEWNVIDHVTSGGQMDDVNYTPYYFALDSAAPFYQYYMLQVNDFKAEAMQLSELALAYKGSSVSSNIVSRKLTAEYVSDSGSVNNAEQAKNLFDQNTSTKWCTRSSEPYVIWKMFEPVSATGYLFVTANDNSRYPGRNPRSWTLYGCNASSTPDNNSSAWNVIDRVTFDSQMDDVDYTQYYFELDSAAPSYQYYMLQVNDFKAEVMQLSELALAYKGSNFSFHTFS